MTNENITLEAALEKLQDDAWKMAHLEPRHREALLNELQRLRIENELLRAENHTLANELNANSANYISPGNWGGYT